MQIESRKPYAEWVYDALLTLWDGVKKFLTKVWQGIKRFMLTTYVGRLQLEDSRLASILYVVRKTVKRNKIMKRRIAIRDIIRRIEGSYEDGKERTS